MVLGVLGGTTEDARVALVPENVAALKKLKIERILVQSGAGELAKFSDQEYESAGAEIVSREKVLSETEVLLSVLPPSNTEISTFKEGKVILSVLNPYGDQTLVKQLADQGTTTFSMDVVPRTTRAQAMDILSSMATVAGYKAVLLSATHLPAFFPMFMTAAGTITPSKVLILGAGVAGLQAIATSRRLGAVVEAFDVRAAAKEEVLSLGAKFVEVEGATDDKAAGGYAVEQSEEFKNRQAAKIQEHAAKADVIICTAQIPGRKAPLLVTADTVAKMKPGSVIVDLAASTGGNCELTENDKTVVKKGVTIIGNSNLAATMPLDASKMFGKNMINFLKLIIDKEGGLNLNFEDDIVKGTCITHNKSVTNERVKGLLGIPA